MYLYSLHKSKCVKSNFNIYIHLISFRQIFRVKIIHCTAYKNLNMQYNVIFTRKTKSHTYMTLFFNTWICNPFLIYLFLFMCFLLILIQRERVFFLTRPMTVYSLHYDRVDQLRFEENDQDQPSRLPVTRVHVSHWSHTQMET